MLSLAALLLWFAQVGAAQPLPPDGAPLADTPSPGDMVELTLRVDMEGRPARPHTSWSLWVQTDAYKSGGGAPESLEVGSSAMGDVLVPSLAGQGNYDIYMKGRHTLRVVAEDILVDEFGKFVDTGLLLLEGDANNDNVINAADASILASSYWQTDGGTDQLMADFNEDGVVNAIDASLIANNYWATGVGLAGVTGGVSQQRRDR